MVKQVLFQEKQTIKQSWIGKFLLLTVFLLLGALLLTIATSKKADLAEYFAFICLFILLSLALSLRLETVIDGSKILFRLFPFQLKFKEVLIGNIREFRSDYYKPLSKFGGWGLRFNFNNARAYTLFGSYAFIIVTENGEKLYIGTQKIEEASQVAKILTTQENHIQAPMTSHHAKKG